MNTVKADLMIFLLLLILNTRVVNSVSKKTFLTENESGWYALILSFVLTDNGHLLALIC